ncbi:hypothetical protein EDF22_0614 [Rathayibacter sp. PhB127]|uniref:hypothetical protein n=1 Tax=Rathayibacter sp. PhB127 TaxID=2485176 RepID=UPI000F4CDE76|nr:hypothetical protein [Rathayibacter sp. PhB127]ROS28883.1 hypothetical protein EDF22_0614 [Rathayibacter sp. PhB127]
MDITQALAPTSDQIDAIELVEPRTFTIAPGSRLGKRDGKTVAEIRLVEVDRVWRPSKGMLDVLAACWGTKGDQWVGRRVTVYNKPDVMFGPNKVGGIRISHLSNIEGPRDLLIRGAGAAGRKQTWHVDPLADAAPARDWLADLTAAGDDLAAIAALGKAATEANAGAAALGPISEAYNRVKAAGA